MTLKAVMNVNGALGHAALSTVSSGVFSIISIPSTKSKAGGAGLYRDTLKYTFAGGDAVGFQSGTVTTTAAQSINPTALKSRDDGKLLIRLDDSGNMACEGVPTGGGPPSPVAGAIVEVADAGQEKLKAQ